ncbi:hypothetical protein HFD88_010440 [Aspergillus terreus]|nr:hypothetical protein HFD88_010440 [Aspergillus terreus]
MQRDPVSFDTNGLYILVSDIGAEAQFHWCFYLATSAKEGQIFHLINNEDTGHTWQYQTKPSEDVPLSITLLVGRKIAVMHPNLHGPLAERLAAVSTTPPVTCRLWLKRALSDLDDEGYIQLKESVDWIEEEAFIDALENKPRGRRTVQNSAGSVA